MIGIIEQVLALLRAGCDWDSDTCSYAGHLAVLQWARSQAKAVVGIVVHVPMLLWAVTWQYCSGPGVMTVSGIKRRAI